MKRDPIRTLVADDHLVFRMGLAAILDHPDFVLVGEADNGEEAVRLTRELQPDVVLMDLIMPVLDGIGATARIHRECPSAKILILTTFTDSRDLVQALENGASGVVGKSAAKEELLTAIRRTAAGERVLNPAIKRIVELASETPELTERQLEVLSLAAKGFSNPEIGRILGIRASSVKDHLALIYARLGVATRTEAVAAALSAGLISG